MLNINDCLIIHPDDFCMNHHYQLLKQHGEGNAGAIVMFVGLVRDLQHQTIEAMELEHYPGMTEQCLTNIIHTARKKWSLNTIHLVHRIGKLNRNDQIVLVGVAAAHRNEAFAACEFIMDYLKQEAPFWKAEISCTGKQWVEAKATDQQADQRWKP